MLLKEQDRMVKGLSPQSATRQQFRYPFGVPDLIPTTPLKFHPSFGDDFMAKRLSTDSNETIGSVFYSADPKLEPCSSKDSLDDVLSKRGGAFLKEGVRFNPLSDQPTHNQDKLASYSSPAIKALHDSMMARSSTSDNAETKCNLCNASFPSTWLLEQHTALQHSDNSTASREEKTFINEQ